MELNPIILSYLKLLKETSELEKRCSYHVSIDDLIYNEFWKESDTSVCRRHHLLIYAGSYVKIKNHKGEEEYIKCDDESGINRMASKLFGMTVQDDFAFNRYLCLDCHTEIDITDYEKFERENIVLKDYSLASKAKDYLKSYYKLLYEINTKDAQEEIRRIYENDSKKNRSKKRKLTK